MQVHLAYSAAMQQQMGNFQQHAAMQMPMDGGDWCDFLCPPLLCSTFIQCVLLLYNSVRTCTYRLPLTHKRIHIHKRPTYTYTHTHKHTHKHKHKHTHKHIHTNTYTHTYFHHHKKTPGTITRFARKSCNALRTLQVKHRSLKLRRRRRNSPWWQPACNDGALTHQAKFFYLCATKTFVVDPPPRGACIAGR